ncbi:hypothetical protein Vadar_013794 [Vaccinium darrowii]|uniref:Uncharacterized protein n=1 Tax=Vaccinium darrowii TaxID=229202 RepID=A0ACB7Z3N3_9ERIC|nr:hypothetical protein Vadar_013794 [Vaccinium darrowii]
MDPLELGNDGYFTSLMQSDCNEDQFAMESQYFNPNAQVLTHETEFTAAMGSSKKPPRGANFTMEEDKMLVSAWLNISMDPVQGNNQKKNYILATSEGIHRGEQAKWYQPYHCFFTESLVYNSNLHKQVLQLLFEGFVTESKWHKRGQQEDDNVAMDSVVDLEEPTENVVDLERPIGSKAKKVHVKKQKDQIASLTLISGALDEIKEGKKMLVDKKLEVLAKIHDQEQEKIRIKKESLQKTHDQEQEKIRIKRERLEMDQFKEDERVMMMDLNGLSEGQQEFYKHKQMEILEKRRAK